MSNPEITSLPTIFSAHAAEIQELCRRYGVRSLRVFGSAARGTANSTSDIDLLVQFSRPVGLLHLVRLQRELTEVLGRPVDLVTEKALSPYIRPRALAEAQIIYESA
ncbi:MAG: nucleotidyltransferase family protein [Chloroflexi bacterium]|nr:nucleotidyltransferase family protein [Chloroflexota bacterium]